MKLIYEHTCAICGVKGQANSGEEERGYVIGPGYRLPSERFYDMKRYMPDGWRWVPQLRESICPDHDLSIMVIVDGKNRGERILVNPGPSQPTISYQEFCQRQKVQEESDDDHTRQT